LQRNKLSRWHSFIMVINFYSIKVAGLLKKDEGSYLKWGVILKLSMI
jgi:hypothetical protein